MTAATKPKRWTSARVCPACGSRATKIFSLGTGKYRCQICDHRYAPPPERQRRERLCTGCYVYSVPPGQRLCEGCDAYRDHTGHFA